MREGTVQGERQSSDSHGSHRHLDSAAVLKGTTRSLNTHRPLFIQHSPPRARPTLCFQYLPRTGRMEEKDFSVAHNLGDTPSGSDGKQ